VDRDAREPLPHRSGQGASFEEVAAAAALSPGSWPYASSPSTHHVAWDATLAALHRWRGLPMPAITSRRAAYLAAAVVVALLVGGCGQAADSTAAPEPTASTLPPTTTIPPLSAEEVAWLDAFTKMKKTFEEKRDKVYRAGQGGVSRALMVLLGKTVGACGRELARIGAPPSDRLQPVYALAKKACQQLGKAAKCHATQARLSDARGGVVVGSPQERDWEQAGRCAEVAEEKGLDLLGQAEAKGVEIKISLPG
jgi:hypothetical protein